MRRAEKALKGFTTWIGIDAFMAYQHHVRLMGYVDSSGKPLISKYTRDLILAHIGLPVQVGFDTEHCDEQPSPEQVVPAVRRFVAGTH